MVGVEFIDKTDENSGTPLNRRNLLAVQGFTNSTLEFQEDGSILEFDIDTEVKRITSFNDDGTITEKLIGQKTITKTTIFNEDGSIWEVLS